MWFIKEELLASEGTKQIQITKHTTDLKKNFEKTHRDIMF